jgi:tetratricopeptide (TPR) repeat protein
MNQDGSGEWRDKSNRIWAAPTSRWRVTRVPSHSDEQLLNIERLVDSERYREALHEIEQLRKKRMDIGDRLRIGVLESRCLTGLGEFNRAFQTAQLVVEIGNEYQQYRRTVIEAMLEMAAAAGGLGEPDKIFGACEQAERMRKDLQPVEESSLESIRADILYHESLGWYLKDDVHRGIDCAHESLSIRERSGNIEGVVSSLMRLAYLHIKVDPRQSIAYQGEALELNRQLGRKRHVIRALLYKGSIQILRNWDEAEQLLKQGMSLIREYDIGRDSLMGLKYLGNLYWTRGDVRRAGEYQQQCLSESERVGSIQYISMSSINLAEMHRLQGDFDEALEKYKRCMEISKRIGRIEHYVLCLMACGLIEYARGDLDKALHLLEASLATAKKRVESGLLMQYLEYGILFSVLVLVDMGMFERAHQLAEDLRQIVEESGTELTNQIYRTTIAIVLKSSTLARNRALAKEYLAEVVDGIRFDLEVNTIAHLLLCELLFEDLRLSGDRSVLDELKSCLARLAEASVDQGSTILQAETLFLQSKVALLDLEAEEANRLVNQARSLADQKGQTRLSKRMVDEHEMLLDELSIWERLGKEKPGMAERTEKIRIHEQIGEMLQQGSWRKMLF